MNDARLKLHLAPETFWTSDEDAASDVSSFAADALAIERRMGKSVNLVNERMRYRLCCRRIQGAVLKMNPKEDARILGEGYFDVLRTLYEHQPEEVKRSRAAACFFRPDQIEDQIEAFERLTRSAGLERHPDVKKRIEFFKIARALGAGVVERLEFLAPDGMETPRIETGMHARGERFPAYAYEEENALSEEKRQSLLNILKSRIRRALETGEAVNFSNQPHSVITEALNAFVYKKEFGEEEPIQTIRVVYADASEAEPFPILCLARLEGVEKMKRGPLLKASLVSMRHLAMDEKVDFAWFRNRKVSASRSFAETDAWCAARTLELLEEIRLKPFHLRLYQTGLETAVIGFYRGLVQFLRKQRRSRSSLPFRVEPFYYNGKTKLYTPGAPWT